MMTKDEAREFASRWLPAWTGNNPEKLAAFYADDALYSDHLVPKGVIGKVKILAHFRKLLGQNPEWVWTLIEAIPMEGGFLCKWLARIPVVQKVVQVIGVWLVQFDDLGKIRRNEVYFDPREVVAEIMRYQKQRWNTGSMYHYFTNKEQLAAVVLEGIADYQAGFMEELDHHEDVQNSILAVIQNCLKWVEQYPDWFRFLFQKRYAEFIGERKEEQNRLNAFFKLILAVDGEIC